MTNPTETTRSPDTWWTIFRWRVAIWFVYRGLRIAPDGSAAIVLEDRLREWSAECRMAWEIRYPEDEHAN